jgi:hypothetical protein
MKIMSAGLFRAIRHHARGGSLESLLRTSFLFFRSCFFERLSLLLTSLRGISNMLEVYLALKRNTE